jgi:DNA-binding SARP family transcriptional activator
MFIAMLDKLMDFCQAHHQLNQGISYGMRLLHLDATHESTHRRLMRLYSAADDQAGALRQFKLCVRSLEKEFGVRPTEHMVALFEQTCADQGDTREHLSPATSSHGSETAPLAHMLPELANICAYVTSLQHDIEQIKQAVQQLTAGETLQPTVGETIT